MPNNDFLTLAQRTQALLTSLSEYTDQRVADIQRLTTLWAGSYANVEHNRKEEILNLWKTHASRLLRSYEEPLRSAKGLFDGQQGAIPNEAIKRKISEVIPLMEGLRQSVQREMVGFTTELLGSYGSTSAGTMQSYVAQPNAPDANRARQACYDKETEETRMEHQIEVRWNGIIDQIEQLKAMI